MAETRIQTRLVPDPDQTRQIAENLSALATSVRKLMAGPLKRKALLILLASSSRLSQEQVGRVLDALAEFEKDWLK